MKLADLERKDKSVLMQIVIQQEKEIHNLQVSLEAQNKIAENATHEMNKMKGITKEDLKKIAEKQERELKQKESQFKKEREFN